MAQKLDNLFYLFLNQLNFFGMNAEALTFKCSCVDFVLIPDDINITIEVYYELGRVKFQAHKGHQEFTNFELVSEMVSLIETTNLVMFRDWVQTLIPKNP